MKTFVIYSEAWYTTTTSRALDPTVTEKVSFSDSDKSGQLVMSWHDLGQEVAPRLNAFNDSWKLLYSIPDLLKEMAEVEGQNITPRQFAAMLKRHAFKDTTVRKRPVREGGNSASNRDL